VVKRYNIKNTWHWLRRSLRVTRAAQSWRLSNLLRLFGVPTAKPVAFIEKRVLGLRNKSYFIMEYVNGEHMGEYFAKYKEDDAHFEKIAMRVVTLLNNLTKLRVSHGDLKVTNILIENDRPVIIDLDGMSEHASQAKASKAFKKDFKRFMKNWDRRPSVKALFERLFQV
jgi:tRNA A-37 threonylcarbamoyl transferase component Bud32